MLCFQKTNAAILSLRDVFLNGKGYLRRAFEHDVFSIFFGNWNAAYLDNGNAHWLTGHFNPCIQPLEECKDLLGIGPKGLFIHSGIGFHG